MFKYYISAFKNYTNFKGRATRPEFWYFVLYNFLIGIALNIIFPKVNNSYYSYNPLYSAYILAVFLPSLALSVRRLHDIGKSGWMISVSLIPLVGFIWCTVLLATDSNPQDNQYGPNPKQQLLNNKTQTTNPPQQNNNPPQPTQV